MTASSDTLIFYTNPMSRGQIVRWMLEEIGRPYETEIVQYGAMKAPAYLAINPMGKVPALRHGDAVVTECAAILAYLADAFPEAGLAPPPGAPARGPYYRWLMFGTGCIEPAITNAALGVVVPDERRAMVGYGSMEAVLDTLEAAVSTEGYLAGDRFSAADLYIAAQLGFGMQFGSIPARPAFSAFADRMYARPAAVKAKAIDNALIAEAQAQTQASASA